MSPHRGGQVGRRTSLIARRRQQSQSTTPREDAAAAYAVPPTPRTTLCTWKEYWYRRWDSDFSQCRTRSVNPDGRMSARNPAKDRSAAPKHPSLSRLQTSLDCGTCHAAEAAVVGRDVHSLSALPTTPIYVRNGKPSISRRPQYHTLQAADIWTNPAPAV